MWGTSWGEQGYMRLKRGGGGKGMCNIAEAPAYPMMSGNPINMSMGKPNPTAMPTDMPTGMPDDDDMMPDQNDDMWGSMFPPKHNK